MSSPTDVNRMQQARADSFCWTCRRRRVICDKTLPTCLKCSKAGKECLGYTKPLKWNDGVASRGKMMGKNFPNQVLPIATTVSPTSISIVHGEQSQCVTPSNNQNEDDCRTEVEQMDVVCFSPRTSVSVLNILIDPIFQDMKPITRYYLNYFAEKLCPEAVLHDLPGQNPFRDLISAVGSSPLLLKAMLAAAARHITNLTEYSVTLSPTSSTSDKSPAIQTQSLSKSSRYHAYWYKQVALTQLRKDLEQPTRSELSKDVIVASISLFIWIDLLEAGKNTWRIHLEGMKRLVSLEESATASSHDEDGTSKTGYSTTNVINHPFFFDICITFDIMGATLSRPYKIGTPLAPTKTVYKSLMRAESTSFIGCPAELLFLILAINWRCWSRANNSVADETSPSSTHFTATSDTFDQKQFSNTLILKRIKSFAPELWAIKTTLYTPQPDTLERIHLASAYQNAVLIYFHRVLEPLSQSASALDGALNPSLPGLAHATLNLLSLIDPQHPFIKCIIWPTFIAGAELISEASFTPSKFVNPSSLAEKSSMMDHRNLARNLLHIFWLGYRSINVVNAAELLERIWKRNDETAHGMSKEEYDEYERTGLWSKGVLNCAELQGSDGWKDYWIGEDVDWLFV